MRVKKYFNLLFSSEHPNKMSKTEKILFYCSILLRVSLGVAIVWAAFNQQWFTLFTSSLAFILTAIPPMIEKNYLIHFPIEFEFLINLFIYTSLFLGEVHGYYTRFWWWDIILHAGSGVVIAICGFLLLYILAKENKVKTSPLISALFVFSFAMAAGAVWEILEFGMDQIFGLNMQKSGLVDTMWDLIVDSIGALVVSIASWAYLKYNKKSFTSNLIDKFRKYNQW